MAGTATVLLAIVLLAALLDYLFKGQEGVIHTLATSMVSGLGLQIQNIDLLFFKILLLICISLMLLWVDRYPKSVAIIMATAALFVAIFIEPDGLLFGLGRIIGSAADDEPRTAASSSLRGMRSAPF